MLLHKNLPATTGKSKLFRRRCLDTIAWTKYMVTFDIKNANAILKAHRDFRKMKKHYTEHPDQDLLKNSPDGKRPNILVEYFLKGKRKYSQLQK